MCYSSFFSIVKPFSTLFLIFRFFSRIAVVITIADSHRSIIMNLFGLPLNLLVVSVFLSIQVLGTQGALAVASASLVLATLLMAVLRTCAPLTAIPVPVENV